MRAMLVVCFFLSACEDVATIPPQFDASTRDTTATDAQTDALRVDAQTDSLPQLDAQRDTLAQSDTLPQTDTLPQSDVIPQQDATPPPCGKAGEPCCEGTWCLGWYAPDHAAQCNTVGGLCEECGTHGLPCCTKFLPRCASWLTCAGGRCLN